MTSVNVETNVFALTHAGSSRVNPNPDTDADVIWPCVFGQSQLDLHSGSDRVSRSARASGRASPVASDRKRCWLTQKSNIMCSPSPPAK